MLLVWIVPQLGWAPGGPPGKGLTLALRAGGRIIQLCREGIIMQPSASVVHPGVGSWRCVAATEIVPSLAVFLRQHREAVPRQHRLFQHVACLRNSRRHPTEQSPHLWFLACLRHQVEHVYGDFRSHFCGWAAASDSFASCSHAARCCTLAATVLLSVIFICEYVAVRCRALLYYGGLLVETLSSNRGPVVVGPQQFRFVGRFRRDRP